MKIRKPAAIFLPLVTVAAAAAAITASDKILQFGANGLPTCAYDCTDLYSAQYACPDDSVSCFCASTYVKNQKCDMACSASSDRAKVMAWISKKCPAKPKPTPLAKPNPSKDKNPSSDDKAVGTMSTEDKNTDKQAEKAVDWWRKNWPYFLLAFLLVIIPIMLFAAAVPLRRYLRKQYIGRRTRRSGIEVPPYVPGPVVQVDTPGMSYAAGGDGSYGGGGLLGSYGSSAGRSGGGGSSSVGMSRSEVSNEGSTVPVMWPLQGTVPPLSTRQESWERRLRDSYEAPAEGKRDFWTWLTKKKQSYGPVRQTQA